MPWSDEDIARRAASRLLPGSVINLGIGLPTLVANYLPAAAGILVHSENGIIGAGPWPEEALLDADLINASKESITAVAGASFMDSALSFAVVRGGHLAASFLGAFQVAANGDLANWMIPGRKVQGMGGAMDLVAGVPEIIVLMHHTAPDGSAKLVEHCTLPLTGRGVVDRVITDLAEFTIAGGAMTLVALAPQVSLAALRARTAAPFQVPADLAA